MKSRTFLLLAMVILAMYGISRWLSNRGGRDFSADLVRVDTAQVTLITIAAPQRAEISLQREGRLWIASNRQTTIKTPPEKINRVLGALATVKMDSVVAHQASTWAEYGLTDEAGTRVRAYAEDKLLEEFIIGKAVSDVQTESSASYLRFPEEAEVYAVKGALAERFQIDFDALRDKRVLRIPAEATINVLEIMTPDTTLQYTATQDSAYFEHYLRVLRDISGKHFADDFDEVQGESLWFRTLTLRTARGEDSLVIHCYRDTLREMPFIIRSSQNPDAYFASDSTGVFKMLFLALSDFENDQ